MPVRRPLLTALALSLIAHGVFLAVTGRLWVAMPEEIAFPIEASLAPIPEPSTSDLQARAAMEKPLLSTEKPPVPAPENMVATPSVPEMQPEPPAPFEAPPEPAVSQSTVPAAVPIETPVPQVAETPREAHGEPVAPIAEAPPEPDLPRRPALRSLPGRVEIRYAVQYGEGGFTAGEARYLWESRNGRYTLVSTIEAKGLASLFISGRITQASEGSVNAGGLHPDQYTESKGERRQDSARFLWEQNQLILSGNRGSAKLVQQAQDLLSFPFHLAATTREGEAEFDQAVSNGRKLQFYRFRVVGNESLIVPNRTVNSLHLKGHREGAGDLDVWLDRNSHYLPVQVRTVDQRGRQVTLIAEELMYQN